MLLIGALMFLAYGETRMVLSVFMVKKMLKKWMRLYSVLMLGVFAAIVYRKWEYLKAEVQTIRGDYFGHSETVGRMEEK